MCIRAQQTGSIKVTTLLAKISLINEQKRLISD